jgi:hypothetical protein
MLLESPTMYEYTDIPEGMTCAEYRRRRHASKHRETRLGRVFRRIRTFA